MTPETARDLWMGWWRVMRRYHRYEVEGIEHLLEPGPALLVGYHGRGVARDLLMLQTVLWERTGRMPRGIVHGEIPGVPGGRALVEGMRYLTGEDGVAEAVAAGEQILVTPGGTREGARGWGPRHRVDWGRRTGYLRLALRHRLPIIPLAGRGVDRAYLGLLDGRVLGKHAGLPRGVPLWLALGPLGPWPLSPPFPVHITTRAGPPIHLPDVDPGDEAAVIVLHEQVAAAVQGLLEGA